MKHRTKLAAMVFESGKKFEPSPAIDVLIINYEAVRTAKGLEAILAFTNWGQWACYLALDESIKLKNRNSKQSQSIIGKLYKGEMKGGITRMFKIVRVLSGKPITQGPHDLWAQMVAIGVMSMSYYGFQRRYCRLGGWQDKQVVGVLNEEDLQERIAKVAFQAKKKDWLKGLPPKLYSVRRYSLTGALKRHYDEMEEDFLTYLKGEVVSVQIALSKYEKLAQIQCGFIIKESGEVEWIVEPEQNTRLQLLQEILEEEVSGKAVVVYRHKAVGDLLVRDLKGYEGRRHRLDPRRHVDRGDRGREAALRARRQGHAPAGRRRQVRPYPGRHRGRSLRDDDLLREHLQLDTRSQIEDRIHRMGTVAESCLYVDLSGSDIDERITRALARKENMFQSVFPQVTFQKEAGPRARVGSGRRAC
jgi:hypothetical protein